MKALRRVRLRVGSFFMILMAYFCLASTSSASLTLVWKMSLLGISAVADGVYDEILVVEHRGAVQIVILNIQRDHAEL